MSYQPKFISAETQAFQIASFGKVNDYLMLFHEGTEN